MPITMGAALISVKSAQVDTGTKQTAAQAAADALTAAQVSLATAAGVFAAGVAHFGVFIDTSSAPNLVAYTSPDGGKTVVAAPAAGPESVIPDLAPVVPAPAPAPTPAP